MKVQTLNVDASVLGRCPAAIDMTTGVISINRSVWNRFDNFEKAFVIYHELGHYNLDTDDEYKADAYALRHVYKSAPRSLKRALRALVKCNIVDHARLDALYQEALKLDAEDGNTDAVLELENINYFNNQSKNKKIMTPNTANETYLSKRNANTVRVVRRADGAEGKSHKRNGIMIGECYFSFTNIILIVILLTILFKK